MHSVVKSCFIQLGKISKIWSCFIFQEPRNSNSLNSWNNYISPSIGATERDACLALLSTHSLFNLWLRQSEKTLIYSYRHILFSVSNHQVGLNTWVCWWITILTTYSIHNQPVVAETGEWLGSVNKSCSYWIKLIW